MTVNSATAHKAIVALRRAANSASDTLDMKALKVNAFLGFLASPAPPTLTTTATSIVPKLVRMLWECAHVGMTGTHGWQKYRANQLISAVRPGVTTTDFLKAEKVLQTLHFAYKAPGDVSFAQEKAVNNLIAAINAV
jgi:hypothetical protein